MKCKDICGFMVSVMDLFFLVDFWVVITYGVLVTKLCVAAWDVGLLLEERWLSPDEIVIKVNGSYSTELIFTDPSKHVRKPPRASPPLSSPARPRQPANPHPPRHNQFPPSHRSRPATPRNYLVTMCFKGRNLGLTHFLFAPSKD